MGCPGLRPLLACPCITGAPSGLPQAQALASLPMHYGEPSGLPQAHGQAWSGLTLWPQLLSLLHFAVTP